MSLAYNKSLAERSDRYAELNRGVLRMNKARNVLWWPALLFAFLMLRSDAAMAAAASSLPYNPGPTSYSLIAPRSGQFDLQISGLFGFTGPGSIVRVSRIHHRGHWPSLFQHGHEYRADADARCQVLVQ